MARKYEVKRKIKFSFDTKSLDVFLYIFIMIAIYFLYIMRDSFFRGYTSVINYNSSYKGSFIALSIMLFSISLIYMVKTEVNSNKKFINLIRNKYIIFYMIISLMILSLGGRLYFITAIISLLVYYSNYFKKIKLNNFIYMMLILMVSMGAMGVMRLGNTQRITDKLFFNLIQEPVYTSFSLISFLDSNSLELFNFPVFLIGGFINIIPTFIMPNKLNYIPKPRDYGYIIHSPLGAQSMFVSYMVNFGFIGSIIVLYLFGFYLQRLKKQDKPSLSKVIYIMISGFLTFSFFRDGEVTSIVKNIFQFSILMPFLFVISANKITEITKVIKRRIDAM